MMRVFPPFMWRLTDYLTGRLDHRPADVIPALAQSVLDVSEPEFAFVDRYSLAAWQPPTGDLGGPRLQRIIPAGNGRIVVPPLPAGKYILKKDQESPDSHASAYARILFSQPDPRESDTVRISENQLATILDNDVSLVSAGETPVHPPYGKELWRWIVITLIGAYFLEAVAAWVFDVRREKRRLSTGLPAR